MDLTFTCMDVEQNPLVSQFDERRDLCHSWLMANTENLTLFLKAIKAVAKENEHPIPCLLYTSPSPRDATLSRMPSSA